MQFLACHESALFPGLIKPSLATPSEDGSHLAMRKKGTTSHLPRPSVMPAMAHRHLMRSARLFLLLRGELAMEVFILRRGEYFFSSLKSHLSKGSGAVTLPQLSASAMSRPPKAGAKLWVQIEQAE
jgi:hypothetical protein